VVHFAGWTRTTRLPRQTYVFRTEVGHSSNRSSRDIGGRRKCNLEPDLLGGLDSIVQNDVEQRSMNPDATVVFNKAELAKAIHEEANAGPSGTDHFRQCFLRDLRNQRFRFPRLAKLRQQQENPGQNAFRWS